MTTTSNTSASGLLELGIYQYLQSKGYSKSLKKFLKEATDLETDGPKVTLVASLETKSEKSKSEKKKRVEVDEECDEKEVKKEDVKSEMKSKKQKTESIEVEETPKKMNVEKKPFQRVDPAKVEFLDERLRTNDYLESKPSSYGDKAYAALAPTKGADFRKEKNKKKKGTYKGGQINTSTVHSIKFSNSSDDE